MTMSKLVQVAERPKSGQYVAVWIHGGEPFCLTYRIADDGSIQAYDSNADYWYGDDAFGWVAEGDERVTYFVAVEDGGE
jgi:hypothetical protein